MSGHHPFRKLSEAINADPERRARVEQYKSAMGDAMTIAELREAQGVTQDDLARKLNVTQPSVSQRERKASNLYVRTLAEHIEALGGRLEITAVFPEKRVTLLVSEPEADKNNEELHRGLSA